MDHTILQGKIAIVTGASRGIGAAITRELAAQGATVVVNHRDSAVQAEGVVAEIAAAGSRLSVKGNCRHISAPGKQPQACGAD